MMTMAGSHYGIILKTKGKKMVDVLFLDDQQGQLTSFKAISKVHKINNHKKMEQLICAYKKAGWISLKVINIINCMVNNC